MINEAKTDRLVNDLLKDAKLEHFLQPQKPDNVELRKALATASKNQKGNRGSPDYSGVVRSDKGNEYVLIIEDKASLSFHENLTEAGIEFDVESTTKYAVNGAVWYAQKVVEHSNFKNVFALAISGNEKRHHISIYYVDSKRTYRHISDDLQTFIEFEAKHIDTYYERAVLGQETRYEYEVSEILKEARELHEYLRNYGSLGDQKKPIVVAGLILALWGEEKGFFSFDTLRGNQNAGQTDGDRVYQAIEDILKDSNVKPERKFRQILHQFSIIKDNTALNEVKVGEEGRLDKTPIKFFLEFLKNNKIFKAIKANSSSEDFLGRFYGEFMSYSGGDGKSLGIVLTPKHICDLFCELVGKDGLRATDTVFDPCCGTGGFLVSAMHMMKEKAKEQPHYEELWENIRQEQLWGIELQPEMFVVSVTNMILRGDGKAHVECQDFMHEHPQHLKKTIRADVGMMNPPYSQGSKNNPNLYEICFIEHLLDSCADGATVLSIVPMSTVTGKSQHEKNVKKSILKKHSLLGTITLNPRTFGKIGVHTCIAVFKAHRPHGEKVAKFLNFKGDGYEWEHHKGLVKQPDADDKKQRLLHVWRGGDAETSLKVDAIPTAEDEWLHSFYYFNEEIPTHDQFEDVIADYLTFEADMIAHGRGYLFEENDNDTV